jgi:pyrroline-5-carboxylate reductase
MLDSRIAILGCGTMGQALLEGLIAAGTSAPDHIVASVRRGDRAVELSSKTGVSVTTDNVDAASRGDVILLCVKPQGVEALLENPELEAVLRGKLLISICAGVRLQQLRAWLPHTRVIRAMPNTPCLIREGMTVLSAGADDADLELARVLFASVGRCRVLEEKHFDAVTALSGSGPAFGFVMLEALADGGVMMGLPRDAAFELAAQTMQGAARLMLASGGHPAALKDDVTTPGGCTIAGLLTMEDGRIRSVLARTIQEATRVAGGLGKKADS